MGASFNVQVWGMLFVALVVVTGCCYVLSYCSPFGSYDAMRLRKAEAPPSTVRKYLVESCEYSMAPHPMIYSVEYIFGTCNSLCMSISC